MNSNLYEAMRTELRHAVEEIRTEFEQVCTLVFVVLFAISDFFCFMLASLNVLLYFPEICSLDLCRQEGTQNPRC